MKLDLYTKVVLTGILICMAVFLLRDVQFEKRAEALEANSSEKPMYVVITGCTNGIGGPVKSFPVSSSVNANVLHRN